jgi:CRISPR/Cas system-associated endoribonuclease Cas2
VSVFEVSQYSVFLSMYERSAELERNMRGLSRYVQERGFSVIKTRLNNAVSRTVSSLTCIGMMGRSASCSDCVLLIRSTLKGRNLK